ncbi:MAG: helix-turn-helix domain-containing protein [Candidatus Goldbacteria bacterium]|nr:helix-turn-helix domain-containing protein [Candidatus Goldiibacteriota bacterium]
MKEYLKNLGIKIRFYRENAGLTQEQLSELINVSQNFLSQIENGKRTPSLKTIIKISEVLKMPVFLLFQFDEPKKKDESILKKYEPLINSLSKKEQLFLSDVIKETAFKIKKILRKQK